MKIDATGDLMFMTYYMVDWSRVGQVESQERCTNCGTPMRRVERVTDKKGRCYYGLVCHGCKALLWMKSEES